VRCPHFCCNSLGLQRTRCLSEQLDQAFHSPIRQRRPMLDPPVEQLCIGATLRHGILDQRCAPIAAPLTVMLKIVKHQGQQSISISTCQLSELYIEHGVDDWLYCQIERCESFTPIVRDKHFFRGFPQRLPSRIFLPALPRVCA